MIFMRKIKVLKDGSFPKRHQGVFNPQHEAPFELSRGKIEDFIRCPACFWLEKARGVEFPGMPGFNLNTNTDTLLKRDHDRYRGSVPTPLMVDRGLGHLRPFAHDDLDKWTTSTQFGASDRHFNFLHKQTNILFGGGLDDVWENIATGELHIVDFKSTAQLSKEPKPLDRKFLEDPWKAGYKRQMDMYQWILRRKGFSVSNTGFFLYVDGQHLGCDGMLDEEQIGSANMVFKAEIIPYEGDDSWVEDALFSAKEILLGATSPQHASGCEMSIFINDYAETTR